MSPNQTSIPERLAAIPPPSQPSKRWRILGVLVGLCLLLLGAVAVWHFVRVTQQIGKLKDADSAIRQKAAEALGRSKSSRAVEPLIAALHDTDSGVQGSAATALGEIKDPRAVQPLMAALRDAVKNSQPSRDSYGSYFLTDQQSHHQDVARQAGDALGNLGAPALEDLMAAFKDKDLNQYAASGLVQMGAPAVDALVAEVKNPDSVVRTDAARVLGDIKNPRAVDSLVGVLQVKDLQWYAALALGKIKDPRAVQPLIAALSDKDAEFREQVAFSLGDIKDPRADAALTAALKDPEPKVLHAAASALGQIADPQAVNVLLAALHQHNAEVIAGAGSFFIQRGEPGSEDALIEALDKSGDESLAVNMLNSGNQKLYDAANHWASTHNYIITYTPGGNSPSWGNKQ